MNYYIDKKAGAKRYKPFDAKAMRRDLHECRNVGARLGRQTRAFQAHHSQPVAAERVVSGAEPDRDDPHMVSHG